MLGWQLKRMTAHLDNEILRLILMQSYPTHCNFFPSKDLQRYVYKEFGAIRPNAYANYLESRPPD